MRRIGSSLATAAVIVIALTCAGQAEKNHQIGGVYAVVGGTVFRESGYALPGAEVVIVPDPQAGQEPVKIHEPKAISDHRGEFAFRVPLTAMRYTVKAHLKGFDPQQKSVDIEGEQRVDVTLILPAVSK
jgi:hypothetical protein